MFEYYDMAKYYDLFYANKSYDKETQFLKDIIDNRKTILDVGCGTGIHMKLLEEQGYCVDGLDLSKDMLEIAKLRTHGHVYLGNLLDYSLANKYDVIISMFAVFNHLKDYDEFEKGILHWFEHLKENGILIIDLHNGRTNGEKENAYNNYKRMMKWTFNTKTFQETTDIVYYIDGKEYRDTHIFKIYEIDKIKNILDKHHLHYQLYENYSFQPASDNSKNIQIVIMK